ncbi:MAG: YncE family protein [Bacteroidales bacterium]|nr:YncE family protein [Bacteroidales bacterium]
MVVLFSCSEKNEIGPVYEHFPVVSSGNHGVFIINEGLFNFNLASLSFYNTDSCVISNGIFFHKNHKTLGDLAQSIFVNDSLTYIVVNNSGKIEVINTNTCKSVATIFGFQSPRYVYPISNESAVVSDLKSDYLTIISLKEHKITGEIYLGNASECVLKYGTFVFSAFWSNINFTNLKNNIINVVDCNKLEVIKNIEVGTEPNSMVIDKAYNLWVLCSGGYTNKDSAKLFKIDTELLMVDRMFTFKDFEAYPSRLSANGRGDTLYYINNGIFRMSIYDEELPENEFIKNTGISYYGLGINPENSDVYIADALTYQQEGMVFRYSSKGVLIDSFEVGVIPSAFAFK